MSEIAEPTAAAERPSGRAAPSAGSCGSGRITFFYPGLARRVGIGLSEAEGIKASDDEEVARSAV